MKTLTNRLTNRLGYLTEVGKMNKQTKIEQNLHLPLDAINNVIQKEYVKKEDLQIVDNSFTINIIKNQVFNQGHNYVPPLNTFRDSEIADCARKIQFKKMVPDLATEFDDQTQGTFTVGNAVHEYNQDKIIKNSVVIAKELQVKHSFKDIVLTGHIDLLVVHPDLGIMVTDIKTMSPKAFHWQLNGRYGISKEYQIQANNYANKVSVLNYSILCINKENHLMKEVFFKTNPNLFQAILEKCQLIYLSIKNKLLLPRLPEYPDFWKCQYERRDYMGNYTGEKVYCQYFDVCSKVETYDDLVELEVE